MDLLRDGRHDFLEAGIFLEEGGRRFGPSDQIGMGRIGGTGDFGVRSASLRDTGDVGTACLVGQLIELGNVLVPNARFGPGIVGSDVEVGLNKDGGGGGCGLRRRHENAGGESAGEEDTGDACDAPDRAATDEQAAGDQGVAGNEDEGDAVYAGPWRKVSENGIVDLRVAELVPGNRGDAGGSKVERDPEDGRGDERPAEVACGAVYQHHSPGEDAEVEAE